MNTTDKLQTHDSKTVATPSPKAREHATWTTVAPGWKSWDAYLARVCGVVSERMLAAARVAPGQRVLDIASGTGEPALPAAAQVGPKGYVLGTDFVEEMLAFAREKAQAKGLAHLELRRVDGEELAVADGSFDAVLCRWGLMFMPDAPSCLRRAHGALRPGGRFAAAVWAGPAENPWVRIPLTILRRHVDVPPPAPNAPGMFAYADPGRVLGDLETAGFHDVVLEEVPLVFDRFETGEHFVRFLREIAGPIAALFGKLGEDERAAVTREIAAEMETFRRGDEIAAPATTWLVHATR